MNIDRSNPECKDYKIDRLKDYNGVETWRPFRWHTDDAIYFWQEMYTRDGEWPESLADQHALCVKLIKDEKQKHLERVIEVVETEYL